MQLDLETVRWILSGFFLIGGGLVSWLMNRQIQQAEKQLGDHDERIDEAHALINAMQLEVAKNYVSKMELEKQLDTHLAPLRSDMQEVKGDLKQLLKRP